MPIQTQNHIIVTDNAFKRIKELSNIAQTTSITMRISVEGGGCSGFTYKYAMTDSREENDMIFTKDGACLIIDQASSEYMQDSVIDFIEELGGSYFSIKNPKATAKCGCGNSFAV